MKSRKRLTKQILSIALCFAVILSCLPISVFAAETEANPYYNRIVDVNTMNNWMSILILIILILLMQVVFGPINQYLQMLRLFQTV